MAIPKRKFQVPTIAVVWLCLSGALAGGQPPPDTVARTAASEQSPGDGAKPDLNVVGRVDSEKGESRRNENVQFNLIDNNALEEMMGRLGARATIVPEFRPDRNYFGAEFGEEPADPIHLKAARSSLFHGTLHYSHNNSIFNARSFFQATDVKPARENEYGLSIGLPAWRGAMLSIDLSQRKMRGSVNGNVQVPMPEERIPLTTDPQLLQIVRRYLSAFPAELPNRTDVNPRMLNTNAPQRVNNDVAEIRLDQSAGPADRIMLSYGFNLQNVDAFQLVAGQNPDTITRIHTPRATWSREWSAATVTNLSAGLDRIGSLLGPEENAVGPMVGISRALTTLGPGPDIPIDRAENIFSYAGGVLHARGNHNLTAGFEIVRRQLNGYESSDHRGVLQFINDFGRDAITNLRMGTPSWLYGALGNINRGYRGWQLGFYFGDNWKVTSRLNLNFGIRHEAETRATEVNNLDRLAYKSDWNNLAPRFGFAYALPGAWGLLRGAYGIHFGQIFPVTYSQARYNPPLNTMFQLHLPDLHLPISQLLLQGGQSGLPPRVTTFSPDLVAPYSHQYNFSWETAPSKYVSLQLGYVGSRSHKLLSMWFLNRAEPVAGIPQTFDTIQQRRPNPLHGEERSILNGSQGYFDAGRVAVTLRPWRGFSGEASYWLSKTLALGMDHLNTAAGSDGYNYFTPSQYAIQSELKGPADFDQPHAFMLRGTYHVPATERAPLPG